MVPYFGPAFFQNVHSEKPIRFEYKNWVLASSYGYPYKFETYSGAPNLKDSSKPLGPQVVCSLLSVVKNPTCHRVYFYNFFMFYFLLCYLHENKFRALWTIREYRSTKCPLRSSIVLKEKRGFYDYRSDDYVSIVQWKDNKVVYIASNFVNIAPKKVVKRYSQREKKKIDCSQHFCFYQYNQGKEGVDLLVRFISQYCPSVHGKKWYWPLFFEFSSNVISCILENTLLSKSKKAVRSRFYKIGCRGNSK